jgi:aminoglycoside phosphotransferase (APT) family kinase protein
MDIVERPPLLILDTVRRFLEEHDLGAGTLRAERIGEGGGSNFSFLLLREDGSRFVLRRPPRPPLPPTAHDVVRESKLQLALASLRRSTPTRRPGGVWPTISSTRLSRSTPRM